jgi:hypothetical protein
MGCDGVHGRMSRYQVRVPTRICCLPKYQTRMEWLKVFSGNCSFAKACVFLAISELGGLASSTDISACLFLSTSARLFLKLRGTAAHPLADNPAFFVSLDMLLGRCIAKQIRSQESPELRTEYLQPEALLYNYGVRPLGIRL